MNRRGPWYEQRQREMLMFGIRTKFPSDKIREKFLFSLAKILKELNKKLLYMPKF